VKKMLSDVDLLEMVNANAFARKAAKERRVQERNAPKFPTLLTLSAKAVASNVVFIYKHHGPGTNFSIRKFDS